ncbi:Holliday junction resolvase-like protein [Methanospirillum sp.]|jgi:predicted Holliday junction resolvase-like endonuclease|uniref:Holliday junction resolvase-like protein n=1 Tax=Methanospirillum sp. TaxID=45200 RepID=UPI001BD21445
MNNFSWIDNVTEVVFIEEKTGKTANLTRRECSLKQCIDSKAVRYEIIHSGSALLAKKTK